MATTTTTETTTLLQSPSIFLTTVLTTESASPTSSADISDNHLGAISPIAGATIALAVAVAAFATIFLTLCCSAVFRSRQARIRRLGGLNILAYETIRRRDHGAAEEIEYGSPQHEPVVWYQPPLCGQYEHHEVPSNELCLDSEETSDLKTTHLYLEGSPLPDDAYMQPRHSEPQPIYSPSASVYSMDHAVPISPLLSFTASPAMSFIEETDPEKYYVPNPFGNNDDDSWRNSHVSTNNESDITVHLQHALSVSIKQFKNPFAARDNDRVYRGSSS